MSTVATEESNLIRHAEREMRLAGLYDEDADYGGMLPAAVMQCVRAFDGQGHSGFSAQMTLSILDKVLRFQNLTPLTSDPAEWNNVDDGMWQSQRRADAFSEDGGRTYYLLDEEGHPRHESAEPRPAGE